MNVSRLIVSLILTPFALLGCDLGPDAGPESSGGADSEMAVSTETSSPTTGEPGGSSGESCGEDESSSSSAGTDTVPELSITSPGMDLEGDQGQVYDGYDDELELWFADVELAGTATDIEDGDLGAEIVWSTDQTDLQAAELGAGASVAVRLYSDDCFGTTHTITATVTDSDGNEVSEPRVVNIWTVC